VVNQEKILKCTQFIRESDIIVFAEESWEGKVPHSTYTTLDQLSSILGFDIFSCDAKFCVWHPGSCYRDVHNFYNNHPLRHKIHKHFYGIDLYRLSNKEPNDIPIHAYQYVDFNYNKFISDFKFKLNKKPWTILHVPSNVNTKGTKQINQSIEDLNLDPNKFQYKALTNIPHPQVIEEKKKSIFYIDQFHPQGIGGYGVSTLESLFNSNVTFSTINNIAESMLELTGKDGCPVISLGTTTGELGTILKALVQNATEEQLIGHMEATGQWLEKYYSTESVINFFKSIYND